MTGILIFLLIVGGIIIYKLNDKVEDDKIIKSNYVWKEKIDKLKSIIKHIESKEEELEKKGMTQVIIANKKEIDSYKKEISKLRESIYKNEQYLKEKVRI